MLEETVLDYSFSSSTSVRKRTLFRFTVGADIVVRLVLLVPPGLDVSGFF